MQEINLMLFFISFLLGGVGAWIIAKWGFKLSLFDKPDFRSSHNIVTPKGGGIGILAAFFVSSITLSIPKLFWIPAVFISLISLWGDRSEIIPKIRFLIQLVAGLILLIGIFMQKESGVTSYALLPLLLVFITGTANFYNFMDGINGIACITGIIGFGLIALYTFHYKYSDSFLVLSLYISFACLGFLPFNIPKAKVFLGDVGSILLGFVFAGMVVYFSKSYLDFICLTSFLFPFYVDELTTMIIRIKDGENLTKAHRRHFYQLLVNEYGISHWKVSVGYGAFQLFVGVSIFFVRTDGIAAVLSTLVFYFFIFLALSHKIRSRLAFRA